MAIRKQSTLLIVIYALLGVLGLIFVGLFFLNPFSLESTPVTTRVDANLTKAELLRTESKLDQAEELCEKAHAMLGSREDDVRKAKILHLLGRVQTQKRKYEKARDNLKLALVCLDHHISQLKTRRANLQELRAAEQQHALVEGDLGRAFAAMGNYAEAEAWVKSALEINDQYLGSLVVQHDLTKSLIEILRLAGKEKESDDLELETSANDFSDKDLMAEYHAVDDKLNNRVIDHTIAIKELRAIALASKRRSQPVPYVDSMTQLALLYFETNNFLKAQKQLDEVFTFVKADVRKADEEAIWLARARLYYAMIFYWQGQNNRARDYLQKAGELKPALLFGGMRNCVVNSLVRSWAVNEYLQKMVLLCDEARFDQYLKLKLDKDSIREFAFLCSDLSTRWRLLKRLDKSDYYDRIALALSDRTSELPIKAEVLIEVARTEGAKGNLSAAERDFTKASEIFGSLKSENSEAKRLNQEHVGCNFAELAQYYNLVGNTQKAETLYQKGFDNDTKTHNWTAAFSFAQFHHLRAELTQAEAGYRHVLKTVKALPVPPEAYINLVELRLKKTTVYPKNTKVDTLIRQGEQYLAQNKTVEAKNVFEQALELTKTEFGKSSLSYGQTVRDIATIYYSRGLVAQAAELYETAIAIFESNKAYLPGYVYLNSSLCLMADKAQPVDDMSTKVIQRLIRCTTEIEGDKDQLDRQVLPVAYLTIAQAYVNQNKATEANQYFARAIDAEKSKIAGASADPRLQLELAEMCRQSALNLAKQKRFKKASALLHESMDQLELLKESPLAQKSNLSKEILSLRDKVQAQLQTVTQSEK